MGPGDVPLLGPAVDLARPDPTALQRALLPALPSETPLDDAEHAERQRKDQLLEDGLDRFQLAEEAFRDQRTRELADLNFEIDQWPKEYRDERAGGIDKVTGRMIPARPCLQIDKLDQPIQQIIDEARKAQLGIEIKARGNGAHPDNAYVRQGLIRAIEVDSSAQIARLWALERAIKCGFGCYIIEKVYENDGYGTHDGPDVTYLDMTLRVRRVLNQHSVLFDPFAEEPDWSDGEWCHIIRDIPEKEYTRRYPKSRLALATQEALTALGTARPNWFMNTKAGRAYRVSEHYYVVHQEKTRVYVQGVGERWLEQVPPSMRPLIIKDRKIDVRQVMWCLMNGMEILDETKWEGRYIPVVPVIGKEYNINGVRLWKGIISNAKDAQRSYNVMRSRQLEAIGLASLATWVMAEGQDEGTEEQWDRANTSNFTRMVYKPTTFEGHLTPPPHRDVAEPAIMAITQGVREADSDIKATTGRWDPSLGRASQDRSGRAIHELKEQGESGTSTYVQNLATISMTYEGKVLNDMLEHVFDRDARNARILGDEDEEQDVLLNAPSMNRPQGKTKVPVPLPEGVPFNPEVHKHYNLKDGGSYRVTVTIGESKPTQKDADRALMAQIAEAAPQLVPIFADLWVAASETKAARQIAERIKRNNPYAKGDDEETTLPPQVQQELQRLGGELQKAQQVIAALQEEVKVQRAKQDAGILIAREKNESAEMIVMLTNRKDLLIEEAKLNAAAAKTILTTEADRLEALRERWHQQRQAAESQAHDLTTQAADQTHAIEAQAADHAHEDLQARRAQAGAVQGRAEDHANTLEAAAQAAALAPEPPAPEEGSGE